MELLSNSYRIFCRSKTISSVYQILIECLVCTKHRKSREYRMSLAFDGLTRAVIPALCICGKKQAPFQAQNSISISKWNDTLLGFGSVVRFPHVTAGRANEARTMRGPCEPILWTWSYTFWGVDLVWGGLRRDGGFQEFGSDLSVPVRGQLPCGPGKVWLVLPSIWVQHLGVCKTGSLYHCKSHPNSQATDRTNQTCNGMTLSVTMKGTETGSLDLKPGLPHLWENTASM